MVSNKLMKKYKHSFFRYEFTQLCDKHPNLEVIHSRKNTTKWKVKYNPKPLPHQTIKRLGHACSVQNWNTFSLAH